MNALGTAALAGAEYTERAARRYLDLAEANADKFIGPMPVETFLNTFLRIPPGTEFPIPTKAFGFPKGPTKKRTAGKRRLASQKVDEKDPILGKEKKFRSQSITMYCKGHVPEDSDDSMHWELAEMIIEVKRHDEDIVIAAPEDTPEGAGASTADRAAVPATELADSFVPGVTIVPATCDADLIETRKGVYVCGQLIAYAEQHFAHQFRTFVFSVLIFGSQVRLFRWDRSGVVYTEPSSWRTTHHLLDFPWRFNRLPDQARGFDTTITPYTGSLADEVFAAIAGRGIHLTLPSDREKTLHEILVCDGTGDPQGRRYLAPDAQWHNPALFGRATYGYISYELTSDNIVYIKDCWRVDFPEKTKEGDVYRRLHQEEVPNIPVFDRDWDVCGRNDGQPHKTRTQEFLSPQERDRDSIIPHVHYRMVLRTVGKPLTVRDAIVGHDVAFRRAKILHRDISANNILLSVPGGRGLLIDWDLSISVEHEPLGPQQHHRTGTWQFLSINRLMRPQASPHTLVDDLGSFFWVLLYNVVRYQNIQQIDDEVFRKTFSEVFNAHSNADGWRIGGAGKLQFLRGGHFPEKALRPALCKPLRQLIKALRATFAAFHLFTEDFTVEPEPATDELLVPPPMALLTDKLEERQASREKED
ncbi:hypothetical protein BC834DRAFT_841404 [Gloeopeniophorella convolvens]|nr:hypothetical protein BC834DRAFT_841404 [Gloeopeniophorella convolvens]